jgi:hypothetical protein
MSALKEMFYELRDSGHTEQQALEVIAERLGEPVIETKRIVSSVAGVKLGGRPQRKPVEPPPAAGIDVARARAEYRACREAGSDAAQAVKLTARLLAARPHDVRRVVGMTELELREHGVV